jgi:membrane associated rhomboid family serine protease
MLSDRPYMRDSYGHSPFSALTWLICTIAAGFIIENVFLLSFGSNVATHFTNFVTLSSQGLANGFVWTLVTQALFHDPNNLLHLVFTLLTIFLFGRAVVPEIGAKRFLMVFAAAVALGGITWLTVNWGHGGRLYGASAGVSALIVLFACLSPNQPITFFMIDIGMRAKHLAIGLLVINALGLVLMEIPGRGSWLTMAHSAQLGGMLAGWLYFKFVHQDAAWAFRKPSIELPRWFRKTRKTAAPTPNFTVNLSSAEDLRAEIDRILDKINSEGFQSLTAEEKKRLDHARDHLSRR